MKPEIKVYRNRYGFVPHRLEIEERPELSDFPFNVLFVNFFLKDNKDFSATALYEPEIESYSVNKEEKSLDYRNIYGHEDLLTIVKRKKSWSGVKVIKNERVLWADGPKWNLFFAHLTMNGLSKGERCKFKCLYPIPKDN
ncbi:hypothetical protein ACFL2C_02515 [Patescibacteria group bacterium]